MTTKWQHVWRQGIVPLLSEEQLEILQRALRDDDPRLIQGDTTAPPPIQSVKAWPIEGACALTFCGWQSSQADTVEKAHEFFGRLCFEIDQRMGEPAMCRWFLNWFDDTPRPQMRRELLREVELSLDARKEMVKTC